MTIDRDFKDTEQQESKVLGAPTDSSQEKGVYKKERNLFKNLVNVIIRNLNRPVNLGGVKDFLRAPVKRPVFILIIVGLFAWIVELYLFYARGIRLSSLLSYYYLFHLIIAIIAIAVMGRENLRGVLPILALYLVLPFIQYLIDAFFKTSILGLTKEIGDFFLNTFLTPIPYMIWFLYALRKSESKWARGLGIVIIAGMFLFWPLLSLAEVKSFMDLLNKGGKLVGQTDVSLATFKQSFQIFKKKVMETPAKIKQQIKLEQERALEYATGGYYEGKVEEGAKEELGVFIEQIKPSQTSFFDNEEITVWATLKARTLDEKNPIGISLECSAGEDAEIKGEVIPDSLIDNYMITSFEDVDAGCHFTKEQVKDNLMVGQEKAKFIAKFNFTTQAYLKTYFMDRQRKRALIKEGIDIFNQYGIKDTAPVAQFTQGPVKIGAETTKSLPIGIEAGDRTFPRLGITIENQWQGKIDKITKIIVRTPAAIVLTHCPVKEPPNKKTSEGLVLNEYEFMLDDESIKNDIEDIDKFFSLNCLMEIEPENVDKILGNTPISTRYIQIETTYDYQLEADFDIEIKKSKTEEEDDITKIIQIKKENFDINTKNINSLLLSTDTIVSVSGLCIDGKIDELKKLMKALEFESEEIKEIEKGVEECGDNTKKEELANRHVEVFSVLSDKILEQAIHAKQNLKEFEGKEKIDRKKELDNIISDARASLNNVIEHIQRIKDKGTKIIEKNELKIKDNLNKL